MHEFISGPFVGELFTKGSSEALPPGIALAYASIVCVKRFGYFNDQALGEMEYGSAFDAENDLGEEPNMLFWAALYKISLSMIAILTRRFFLVGTIAHGYGDACVSCVRLPLCRWALARLLCCGSASLAGSFGRFSSCPPNRRF